MALGFMDLVLFLFWLFEVDGCHLAFQGVQENLLQQDLQVSGSPWQAGAQLDALDSHSKCTPLHVMAAEACACFLPLASWE